MSLGLTRWLRGVKLPVARPGDLSWIPVVHMRQPAPYSLSIDGALRVTPDSGWYSEMLRLLFTH